jgi:hypothetical protein
VRIAAMTFVLNESVNLPIWIRHYGGNFGHENLFVVDRGSDDGSTDDLGRINKIRVPRAEFDEHQKTSFLTSIHRGLLEYYDAVVYTDCDEIIVPDPARYAGLRQYIETRDFEYATCVGLNIHHVLTLEPPLDFGKPILSQRKYALFRVATCKTAISRVPINWLPGFHVADKPPRIDPELFVFHTRFMNYVTSIERHLFYLQIEWSERSLAENFGAHARYSLERFVRESFLDPINMVTTGRVETFDFTFEIKQIQESAIERNGYYGSPLALAKMVEIPERFSLAL